MEFTDEEKIIIFKLLQSQLSIDDDVDTLRVLIRLYDRFADDILDKCYYRSKTGECLFTSFSQKCTKICNNYEIKSR